MRYGKLKLTRIKTNQMLVFEERGIPQYPGKTSQSRALRRRACMGIVVVKALTLEISRCRLADFVKARARAARLLFFIYPIRSLFSGVVVKIKEFNIRQTSRWGECEHDQNENSFRCQCETTPL